jgi:hypothetical protein
MKKTKMGRNLAIGALTALMVIGVHANALGAECKGMEKAACERNDQCSWVDPYTRKDGVKVSGHCRKKPKKSSN